LPELSKEDLEVLKALAENPTITEAAKTLNTDILGLLNRVNRLKRKGVLPKTRSYGDLRRRSKILLYKFIFEKRIKDVVERLEKVLSSLGEKRRNES